MVAVGVGPILQMHSRPRMIPLAPGIIRSEHDCVGPGAGAWDVGLAVGWVAGRAVTSVGTPEGSPPVSHHEYVVPLTVALPIPAISPPLQEQWGEYVLLGLGGSLEMKSVSVAHEMRVCIVR